MDPTQKQKQQQKTNRNSARIFALHKPLEGQLIQNKNTHTYTGATREKMFFERKMNCTPERMHFIGTDVVCGNREATPATTTINMI